MHQANKHDCALPLHCEPLNCESKGSFEKCVLLFKFIKVFIKN